MNISCERRRATHGKRRRSRESHRPRTWAWGRSQRSPGRRPIVATKISLKTHPRCTRSSHVALDIGDQTLLRQALKYIFFRRRLRSQCGVSASTVDGSANRPTYAYACRAPQSRWTTSMSCAFPNPMATYLVWRNLRAPQSPRGRGRGPPRVTPSCTRGGQRNESGVQCSIGVLSRCKRKSV